MNIEKIKKRFRKTTFSIEELRKREQSRKKFGKAIFWIIADLLVFNGTIWCFIWYSQEKSTLEIATFVITLLAFIAAAYAIWQQHQAGIKQEIIGAW